MLPQPVHQTVHLQANPRRRTWQGHTELLVLVPTSQSSIGLHCFNLNIHRVTVDGVQAQFTLNSYPKEDLPDPTLDDLRRGISSISSLSEAAYDQYLRLMFREQDPELIITMPKQQQQADAGDQHMQEQHQEGDKQEQQARAADTAGQAKSGTGAAAAAAAGTGTGADAPGKDTGSGDPAPATAGAGEGEKPSHVQLKISIIFSKPSGDFPDTSLLVKQQCMVTNPLLRRSRALFPCIDSPLYLYTPGALHYLPCTFDLHVTVPPSCMAVCSGMLVQQSCSVAPKPANSSRTSGLTLAAAAGDGSAQPGGETVVVARTFEYSVTVPVVPAQLNIAVGPFAAIPYADLLSAGGSGAVSLPENLPNITVFALRPPKAAGAGYGSNGRSTAAAVRQQGSGGGADADAAADGDANGGATGAAALAALDPREVRQLADTLRPLAVLLGCYAKLLACSLPWSNLQVAVVPDGCMLTPWQAGLGSIFLSRSLLVHDSLLLEPRLSSASALAAATAMQYFGLLLLPRGPEDDWLMRGLAGWLEGQGLKTVAGNNELQYKRWQERLSLAVTDDGGQLGPLSPEMREGDRGITAAWGRLHGTKELEPLAAAASWKATAVIHMLERRIGEDELRKVLERIVNGAKHSAASTPQPADAALSVTATPGGGSRPAQSGTATAYPAPSGPPGSKPAPAASAGAQAASGAAAAGAAGAAAAAAGSRVPAPAPAAAVGVGRAAAERIMTTAKFLRQMGKKEGFKKEVAGFAARWVHGTGMPVLSAGVSWDARHSQLLLALRQSGGKAVLRGALKGADKPVMPQGRGAAPRGTCQLKVLVRELDAVEEHSVQVIADDPLSLHELKVTSKTGEQRRRQQRQAEKAARGAGRGAHLGASVEEIDVNEAELQGVPVLWVQVNPGNEWLSVVQLKQPAHWWCLQLQNSKDVVAQAQAVAGLAAQLGAGGGGIGRGRDQARVDDYIITILAQVMRDDGYFCRVRLDAAVALGAASGRLAGEKAMHALLAFTRDRLYDKVTGLLRPNNFTDLGEALINQGLPAALALVRDPQSGFTPSAVLDLLLDMLACNDNSANPVDDGYWLAGLVAALGQCKLACVADLARVLAEIDRQLAHEAVVTTHINVLGVACLQAATNLAVSLQHHCSLQVLDQVGALLQGYCQPGSSRHMKAAAYACLLRISAGKAAAVVQMRAMALYEQQEQERWQQQQLQLAAAAAAGQELDPCAAASIPQPSSSFTEALKCIPAKTADSAATFLDEVLGLALRIMQWEPCPLQQAAVLRETLLLIGQLEQQGKLVLDPAAKLPSSISSNSGGSRGSTPKPAAATAAAAAAAAAAAGGGVLQAPSPAGAAPTADPAAAGAAGGAVGGGVAVMSVQPTGDGATAVGVAAAPSAEPSSTVAAGVGAPAAAGTAAGIAAAATQPTAVKTEPMAAPVGAAAGAGISEQQQQQQALDGGVAPMSIDTAEPTAATVVTVPAAAAAAAAAAPAAAAAAAGPDTYGASTAAAAAAAAAAASVYVPVSLDVLLSLHQLMWSHGEPSVRQLSFMLLQKIAGQPATLYRAREEEEEEEQQQVGPAATLTAGGVTHPGSKQQTAAGGTKQGPAASGGGSLSGRTGAMGAPSARPAPSGGVSLQTGTAATGKKLRFKLGRAGGASPAAAGASPAGAAATAAGSDQQQQQQQQTQPFAVPAPPAPPAAAEQQQQQQHQQPLVSQQQQPVPQPGLQQQQQQQLSQQQPAHTVPAAASQPPAPATAASTPPVDMPAAAAVPPAPGGATRPSPSPAPMLPQQAAVQPPPAAAAAAAPAAPAAAPAASAPGVAPAPGAGPAAAPATAAAPSGGIIRGKPLHKLRRPTPGLTPPPSGVPPATAAAAPSAAGAQVSAGGVSAGTGSAQPVGQQAAPTGGAQAAVAAAAAAAAAVPAVPAGVSAGPKPKLKIAGIKRQSPSAGGNVQQGTQPPPAAGGAQGPPPPPAAAGQQGVKKPRLQGAAPGAAGVPAPAAGQQQQQPARGASPVGPAGAPAAAAAAPAASAGMAPSASTGTAASTKLKFKFPGKIKLKPRDGGGGAGAGQ